MSLHSHDLPVAFAVLQHIRQKLNCELPIQLWIHETDFKSLSPETRGSYILQTITSNLKGVSLHVIPSRLEKSIKTYLAFQIYALANSQFHHVLMLSPNTLPLKDPTNLISSSEYLFFGTLLWPSFTPRSTLNDESLVWTLLAAPPAHPSLHVDTSAFLFDTLARRRELSFLSLYTREHMRMHAIGVAPEDLFGLAWARAGSGPTRLIPRFPGALGVRDEKHARFCGVSKVQFGEDGEALFVQREWSKGVLARWGAMQWFRAGEEALEARLEAFERGVDRDWTDQWFRGMVCLGAGKTDREDVLNDFMMDEVSDELRELELNHVAWVNEAMTLPVGKEDDGVSIKSLWSKAPSVNTWYQKVYLVKCLAILLSSFKEIIFLDADSIPLRDPTNLFSSSESYNRTGAVFWPDYWLSNTPPKYWDILGLPHNSGENRGTFESGQMLVDKERVWEGLLLAVGFNLQPSIHYYLPTVGSCGSGDKETFAMALLTLGIPYFKVPHACGIIGGYKPDGAYKGTVITQHEPDLKEPVVLFFHANNRKMTAKWFLEQPWIWQQEEVRKLVNFDLEWFALDTLVRFVCSEGYLDWVPDEGAFGECLQLRRRLAGAALGTEKRS
ncbi:mannosyltransferase putative-domain-containing protein [Chytriomyces sp. MP71]|nr:mannosyltransferase putative-domain-containing protein [Chytriomyces sp. MP71]